ncbi:gp483 [Bacillus phage G]|uniref:Gp483 n=1 Tax=Bacillus phage G TaxID=2884420 RepID=G3MAM4_9CAUD|nr:gp483 [Bacillus phage G]AEO93741.1 gp483 [Bacillus phage G]
MNVAGFVRSGVQKYFPYHEVKIASDGYYSIVIEVYITESAYVANMLVTGLSLEKIQEIVLEDLKSQVGDVRLNIEVRQVDFEKINRYMHQLTFAC